jgi:beta-glucosidase
MTTPRRHASVSCPAETVDRPAENQQRVERSPKSRSRRSVWLWAAALAGFVVVVVVLARSPVGSDVAAATVSAVGGSPPPAAPPVTTSTDLTDCPWLLDAMRRGESPSRLASLVLARMTLGEKIGEIVLVAVGPYENVDVGVPRLCIPSLALQDGPDGVAAGARNVTQLPSPLGLAASFDPSLARAYGQVAGAEAKGQGYDVLQGPTLNVLRVPEDGRAYEGYGEDPLLVSQLGVADIEGIQSQGVMAQAKHFASYSQETDRGVLDDTVSTQTLNEIYLPPFKAAVTQAGVASVMCAYPRLNGTFQCQDQSLLGVLGRWGFAGFVRSDLGAVHDPGAAISAGTDLLKPASPQRLAQLVQSGRLPMSAVDAAVHTVLTQMFTTGIVGRAPAGAPGTPVDSASDTRFALRAAERSTVLLKNSGSVLPLDASRVGSVAVIGADASSATVTTGHGSSQVLAPFVSTPLDSIRRRAGGGVAVTYSDGGSTTRPLPPIPSSMLTPATGSGNGLALTLSQVEDSGTPRAIQTVEPTVDLSIQPHPATGRLLPTSNAGLAPFSGLPGVGARRPLTIGRRASAVPRSQARSQIVLPAGWSDVTAAWTGTFTPPKGGLYTFAIQGSGAAILTLDGTTAVSDLLTHARGRWSQAMQLVGGHHYRMVVDWTPFDNTTPSGESFVTPGTITIGMQYVSPLVDAAAAAASRAQVAVVFASDYNSEAFDRPSLSLPGDQDALIEAVAAANPRTVVVLDTGGPVLMPWLSSVAGVVEAWYPGEEDGAAAAAVLFGDVDPSGKLPVTFPASNGQGAISSGTQWPGVDLTSTYSEGLDVGYRWYHATGTQPLFPFGFGLSYTAFSFGGLTVSPSGAGYTVTVDVTNTGSRTGTEVPQAYLTDPAAAGQPPAQLAAFSTVTLAPGQTEAVTLDVPTSAFQSYLSGGWTTVPGSYTLSVGDSSANLPLSATVTVP